MNVEVAKDDTQARVLVVDDDPVIRAALCRTLGDGGFNVSASENAQAALDAVATQSFDAIMTDIVMPGMDGIELLAQIRQRDRELPVIILTGNPTLDSAIAVVKEGGFRYLKKPCPPAQLCQTVREAAAFYRLTLLKRRAQDASESGNHPKAESLMLTEQFEVALGSLWMAYQPIVHWRDRKLYGYEALVRTNSPSLGNPGLLFDAAERLGRVPELGRQIRRLVADGVQQASSDAIIFVNLHSADLNDNELYSASAPLSEHAHRVVLEVTERASLERVKDVQGGMTMLRMLGYRIAVDDLGAGYAGLSSFSQLEPDIVKLDMSLIRGVNESKRKASIVRSMIAVCTRDLGTEVVCEGVETEAERDALDGLGATLLQGYLFGRPDRVLRAPFM